MLPVLQRNKIYVSHTGSSGNDPQSYLATNKNVERFDLSLSLVSIGMSFLQTAQAIQHSNERTKTGKLSGTNDLVVGQYFQIQVTVLLQQINYIIADDSFWALSLADDGSTHRGPSFFDLRARVCYDGVLENLNLVAIPMIDRHTAENIFNQVLKFLDALDDTWRDKLICMSSDGDNTRTGRHSGLVARVVTCADNNVLRIWCPPHQMDLVVKSSAEGIA